MKACLLISSFCFLFSPHLFFKLPNRQDQLRKYILKKEHPFFKYYQLTQPPNIPLCLKEGKEKKKSQQNSKPNKGIKALPLHSTPNLWKTV